MYAIVKVGGKQYRVEKGDSLLVDRMPEDEGSKVALEPLLFRGDGDDTVLGGDAWARSRSRPRSRVTSAARRSTS